MVIMPFFLTPFPGILLLVHFWEVVYKLLELIKLHAGVYINKCTFIIRALLASLDSKWGHQQLHTGLKALPHTNPSN